MKKPWYHYLFTRSPIAKIIWGIASVVITVIALLLQGLFEEQRMDAQTLSWEGRSVEQGAALYYNNCASCHGFLGQGGAAPALNSRYFFGTEDDSMPEELRIGRLNDVGWAGSMHDYVELTLAGGRPSKAHNQWNQVMPTWGSQFGGPLGADKIIHLTNFVVNWKDESLAQTPEEDPWQFFQDTLSKGLPYHPYEPGYDAKIAAAIQAAELGGKAAGYVIDGVEAAPAPAARAPQELYVTMTCTACHGVDQNQTEENRGPVGPYHGNLWETAGSTVEGMSAEEYVYTSIVEPNAHIVEGYPSPSSMPATLAEQMTEEEIQGLVAWLLDPNKQID
ncbi:MAG: c-type cytochrome [Chloroflexota bacterium]